MLGATYARTTAQSANFAKAQQQVATGAKKASQGVQGASNALQGFGRNISKTIKNAAAFSLVAGPIFGVQRALSAAAKEAAEFQREILKISQVTGQSAASLGGLVDTIDALSTSLGVNAKELAETARVIAQTGRSGKELEEILEGLAQSTLAASFGDINNTTEGLIAVLGQFNLRGDQTKEILGSINQVSKDFAVESDDLVQAVRRAGAVFNSAAGDTQNSITALQEFNAVFTSVRANTRESSETIAAGLRTIFSRLQRRDTIEFLKDFGVELIDQQGNFVGLFNAFDQLSEGLKKVDSAVTRSAIAEELGGIRQIGKLLPAIENFADAQRALQSGAEGAAKGLGEDVDTALLSVSKRVEQTQAIFNKFIKDVFDSDAFQNFAKNILASTQTLITTFSALINTLEPILPILAALGAAKISSSLLNFAKSGPSIIPSTGASTGASLGAPTRTSTSSVNQLLGVGAGPTRASKAFRNLNKSIDTSAKSFSTFAKTQLPNFTNALSSASKKVQTTFTNLSKRINLQGANFAQTGAVAGQAALGLAVFTATATDADSALGKLANQSLGIIAAFLLLGPAINSAIAQIGAARAAAAAGTLTTGAAVSASAFVVAAPIVGAIIGKIVGDSIVNALLPPLEKLGTAQGIDNRSLGQAQIEGRQKSQIRGASTGAGVGAGLGAAIGTFTLGPGFGTALGAALGGVIGGGTGFGLGSFGGGKAEAAQQQLFNANLRLKESADLLSEAFNDLQKRTDATNLQQFNQTLSKFFDVQADRISALTETGAIRGQELFDIGGQTGLVFKNFFARTFSFGGTNTNLRRLIGPGVVEAILDTDILKRSIEAGTDDKEFLRDATRFTRTGAFSGFGFQIRNLADSGTREDRRAVGDILNKAFSDAFKDISAKDIVGDTRQVEQAIALGIENRS
jgi:TP901 family phage tail tape measure protein